MCNPCKMQGWTYMESAKLPCIEEGSILTFKIFEK